MRPRLAQKAAAAAAAAAAAVAAAEAEEAKKESGNADDDGNEGGKDKEQEEKEPAKGDREKAPVEVEESADTILAEINANKAEFRAKAEEDFKRAMSPDDDGPIPPPEKRKAVGVQRGEDSDDSDDYDGGEVDEKHIYDPFFDEAWPGSPTKVTGSPGVCMRFFFSCVLLAMILLLVDPEEKRGCVYYLHIQLLCFTHRYPAHPVSVLIISLGGYKLWSQTTSQRCAWCVPRDTVRRTGHALPNVLDTKIGMYTSKGR